MANEGLQKPVSSQCWDNIGNNDPNFDHKFDVITGVTQNDIGSLDGF